MESKDAESEDPKDDIEDEKMDETLEQSDELDTDGETNLEQQSTDVSENMSDLEEQDDYNMDVNNLLDKCKDPTIKTMSETNVRMEIEKGSCIRNQLKLWESFLEMRIKLQKCVVISNQMPQYDTHKELRSNVDFVKKASEIKTKLAVIMENMLRLKHLLLKQYPETRNICDDAKTKIDRNKDMNINTDDPMDEEILSDTEDELENEKQSFIDEDIETVEQSIPRKRPRYNEYEKILQKDHDYYKEYRDSVIKKWNDKTWITTGALSKGSSQTTLKQIEFAMSDMSKLRKRTQLKRSDYNVVGKSLPNEDNEGRRIQEYDVEIYDDDDFYHQLLRDLIEYKSSDLTDPIQLSKQWIQLQNMRKKMKRKIDTRATKGRRVRYNVHNKLINFMAPITMYDTWTDNAKNELYNSLFGKIKPTEEQMKQ